MPHGCYFSAPQREFKPPARTGAGVMLPALDLSQKTPPSHATCCSLDLTKSSHMHCLLVLPRRYAKTCPRACTRAMCHRCKTGMTPPARRGPRAHASMQDTQLHQERFTPKVIVTDACATVMTLHAPVDCTRKGCQLPSNYPVPLVWILTSPALQQHEARRSMLSCAGELA